MTDPNETGGIDGEREVICLDCETPEDRIV